MYVRMNLEQTALQPFPTPITLNTCT